MPERPTFFARDAVQDTTDYLTAIRHAIIQLLKEKGEIHGDEETEDELSGELEGETDFKTLVATIEQSGLDEKAVLTRADQIYIDITQKGIEDDESTGVVN